MADYDSVRFPYYISEHAVGGPAFKTSIAVMSNGAESRRQWWETERGQWTVSHRTKKETDWRALLAFFRAVSKGRANTFRFRDWTDYVCANGEGFFVDAATGGTDKQMVKRYTFSGQTYDRIIKKPISGTITTDATGLTYSTGIATSGTTWYGQFDCWCRLDVDAASLQHVDRSGGELVMSWEGIEISEVVFET